MLLFVSKDCSGCAGVRRVCVGRRISEGYFGFGCDFGSRGCVWCWYLIRKGVAGIIMGWVVIRGLLPTFLQVRVNQTKKVEVHKRLRCCLAGKLHPVVFGSKSTTIFRWCFVAVHSR